MAVKQYGQRSIRWRLGGEGFGPFTGGLNLRDSFTEIAGDEFADGTNFTLDERGVLTKRNDCPTSASFPAPPGTVLVFFYSPILALAFIQVGVGVYKCAVGGGAWVQIATQTTTQPIAVTEWGAVLIYTHPVDGTYYYNGTTLTQASNVVKGSSIAIWQNKAWVGSATDSTLWFSSIGAVAFNPGVDFIAIAERDNKPLTALFGGPTLIAFKETSHYRINDPSTGSYTTIDWNAGTVGQRAVTGATASQSSGLIQEGGIYFWGLDGLYAGDGLRPAVLVGDKLRPRFQNYAAINPTTKPMISATAINGRVYFGFPRSATAYCDAILEYNPRVGWINETYLAGQVSSLHSYPGVSGQVASFGFGATLKDLFSSTTRTGFACSLTTGYQEPFGGTMGRIYRLSPELNVPAAASLAVGIGYTDEGGAVKNWTSTEALTNAGTQRLSLQPRLVGRAFGFTLNDTAAPLASLSVLGVSLDALLTGLR